MGLVVEFPSDSAQRRSAAAVAPPVEGMGKVVILPVIRIERHNDLFGGDGTEQGSPSGRGRKRRARNS